MVDIGKQIRRARRDREMSQGELAREAGLALQSINKIENGHTNPSAESVARIARALDVPIGDLFEEREPAFPKAGALEEGALGQILVEHGITTRYLLDDALPEKVQDMDWDEALKVSHHASREFLAAIDELTERQMYAGTVADQAAARQERYEFVRRSQTLRWALLAKFKGDREHVKELEHALATMG